MNPTAPQSHPGLTWDIFCHVIDNWGDLGVCWRLAADLAARGENVRLWVDDAAPLEWMAPDALKGQHRGITIHPWHRTQALDDIPCMPSGDVLIEAFGCEIAPAWVHALQPDEGSANGRRLWLNLEYLSAESYVERMHRLPSPVMSGPLRGRMKWFFYPGFTTATGGLLRETDLLERQAAFDRAAWMAAHQLPCLGHSPVVTLFSYEPYGLDRLLQDPTLAQATWLLAPGRAQAAFEQVQHHLPASATAHALPYLSQTDFDHLLWSSDLNLVRGEDSLVRALWAGKPFVWHIYPQHDNAHHDKLEAFLDWLQAPASLRTFHHVWNGVHSGPLPHVDLPTWSACTLQARHRLLDQDDLTAQLLRFVMEKR